jgi:uncharacterized protein YcbX
MRAQGVVEALRRYPVKSMLGEELAECTIGQGGIAGDRAYALIDETDGKVASAKNPRKWGALLQFSAAFVDEPVTGQPAPPVIITCPDGSAIRSDDPDVDAILSKLLGRSVRLAAKAPEGSSFEEVWPAIEGLAPQEFIEQTTIGREESGEEVSAISVGMFAPPGSFFDLAVLHVLTTGTLRTLKELAPDADFDARRYRPNVLVATESNGFVENEWVGKTLQIGDTAQVAAAVPTMRCVMTTLAQKGLSADRRTLRAIAAHNRVEIPGYGQWACAGVYANDVVAGVVRVGDTVSVSD